VKIVMMRMTLLILMVLAGLPLAARAAPGAATAPATPATAATPTKAASPAEPAEPAERQFNKLYWEGQEALKRSDWEQAMKRFKALEQDLRAHDPGSADTALYWQAYTYVQVKRYTEAKAVVERLYKEFPNSRWGEEATTLMQRAQPGKVERAIAGDAASSARTGDEDLVEAAVDGLMNAPPERALPLLRKVLAGTHSLRIKKRALFVLSQLDDDDALGAVVEVARTNADPELRGEAIRMLGLSGEDSAIARLREIYATSKSAEEKRAVIQSWMVADRKDLLLSSARNEPDNALRMEAIRAMGALGANAELEQLLDAGSAELVQLAIVQSLGVAGDGEALSRIAGSQRPESVRLAALQSLGVAGEGDALARIYRKADSTPAMREAALQGLMISGDSGLVTELYRSAKSAEEKRRILRTLSVMGEDAALDVIESELNR